ncbi:MAG: BMP family ABC transporter substrate-binding protein [Deltaproteobacteria bacterium]|nr:BMP family ABC transporter substrate-binding protein [Deltaproteobacteria bacterium]
MPLSREDLKIGVIHITDPLNETSGYAYAHEVGIREMQRELGLKDYQILRKVNVYETNQDEVEHAMRECILAGANIIIATSWGYMNTCEKLAGEYPGVIFAHASGNRRNDSNFTNYFGRIYQARYLSGIVAGLRTRTNKIGYVAAMGKDNSEVTGGLNAFALGVESVNPGASIHVWMTERWFDPQGEAQSARALLAAGCDVIAQHCNTPTPQIEAQRAGRWGVGYNSDMSRDAPNATIVSVMWNWGVYYTHLVRSVMDGSFTTTPYFGGMAEGMVGLTPFNETLLPAGAAEAVASASERIISGEFGVFDGEMRTNDGNVVGKPGTTLPDRDITEGMNWYYHNIIHP